MTRDREYQKRTTPREVIEMKQIAMQIDSKPIMRVCVVDHAGYGFNVLWTLDGQTWVAFRKQPFNAHVRDAALSHISQFYTVSTEIREVNDFHGRIPEDWLVEGARVV